MAMAPPISATGAMRFALSLALTAHVLSAYFVSKRPHTAAYCGFVRSSEPSAPPAEGFWFQAYFTRIQRAWALLPKSRLGM